LENISKLTVSHLGRFKMTYSPSFFNSQSNGSSRGIVTNFQASTNLDKCTPVSINTSSQLVLTDISNESLVQAIVGLTNMSIPGGASGAVIDSGRIENVNIVFTVGDAVYINFDGTLTNTKPDLDVLGFSSGMFCVFVGVIVKNEFNPSLKDIKLMISVIGQL
jgi:hypothetical protein